MPAPPFCAAATSLNAPLGIRKPCPLLGSVRGTLFRSYSVDTYEVEGQCSMFCRSRLLVPCFNHMLSMLVECTPSMVYIPWYRIWMCANFEPSWSDTDHWYSKLDRTYAANLTSAYKTILISSNENRRCSKFFVHPVTCSLRMTTGIPRAILTALDSFQKPQHTYLPPLNSFCLALGLL